MFIKADVSDFSEATQKSNKKKHLEESSCLKVEE